VIKLLLLAFVFTFVALVLSQLLRRLVRSMHATVSDAMLGKVVHVETPIGVFDLKPHDKLDPELASILVYPGATPVESQPREYEAEAKLLGQDFHVLVATYWTLTPADIVWEFYRRELPEWQESRQRGRGRSLIQQAADGVRTVRVYGQNSSTLIETKISLKHKAGAAAAGSGGSSETRFGILR
jgi:hypothetical protein